MMKSRLFFILLLLTCRAGLLLAGDVKFTVAVSKAPVGTGEQFEVTFSLNGNGDRFTPPNFAGFEVLSGPNVSTSMTSINGNTSVSNSYSYVLMGLREGEFTIGPASVIVNGRRLYTGSFKIKVVKGQPVSQNSRSQNQQDNTITESHPQDPSRSIFIRAILSKPAAFLGEQISVSFRLYTRIGIEDSQADKFPDLTGFFNEDIKKPIQQTQWRIENYKGLKYNVTDIKQTILYPEHEGNIIIDPMVMTFLVRQPVQSHDIMDQFFGSYKDVKLQVKSTPVTVHVKPLPAAGRPSGFSGAVGSFTINAYVDKQTLKANETLNYNVKISGAGNIKLFKPLSANIPADFDKYDPKITDTITSDLSGQAGSRIYNYLLIPRHQGYYVIGPLKFSYFNPVTARYATLTTKAFPVKVAGGVMEKSVTAFSADKQDVKELNADIRYIKTDAGGLEKKGAGFFGSFWYYVLLATGPCLCAAAFVYRNLTRKINSDAVKVKNRKAGKVAARHLQNAKQQLSLNDNKAFYDDIFKGLYGYLSDKLNISYANLNKETIAANLKARGVEDALVTELLNTLDLCEMARFSPVSHIPKEDVFDKASGIINSIEDKVS